MNDIDSALARIQKYQYLNVVTFLIAAATFVVLVVFKN
jgi:hypothetical protein